MHRKLALILLLALVLGCGKENNTDPSVSWVKSSAGIPVHMTNTPVVFVNTLIGINETTLLASTNTRGVYISDNAGSSWRPLNNGLAPDGEILSFAKTDDGKVYAADPEHGIYLLNGNTWSRVGIDFIRNGVRQQTAAGQVTHYQGHLYAPGEGRVLDPATHVLYKYALPGGPDWEVINPLLSQGVPLFFLSFTAGPGVLYASAAELIPSANPEYGVWSSRNGGLSWTRQNSGLPFNNVIYALCISKNKIYAGTEYDGIYVSSLQEPLAWTKTSMQLPARSFIATLAASTDGRIFAGSTQDGVFVSTNEGVSWTPWNEGVSSGIVGFSSFAIAGNKIFAVSNGDIYVRSL